jgi:hypothetical protein
VAKRHFTGGLGILKPPKIPRSIMPTGSSILGLGQKVQTTGGPGLAPDGFIGGTNSQSEWYFYWACLQVIGPEGDKWGYQQSFLGGRHIPGGAVVDFVIYQNEYTIGIRIQTFFFHLGSVDQSYKQADDLEQRIRLEANGLRVVDVYEQNFIHDESGKAAIREVVMAMELAEQWNPLASGLVHE